MITLEVNGIKYDGFTDISVTRNIETISGSFNFSATSNDITSFPIAAGDACRVWIGNTSVINGYVEVIRVAYNATSHSISITGRDRTCDIIDSTIVGVKEFQGMTLTAVIQKVLANHGLSDIQVINEAGNVETGQPSVTADSSDPFTDSDPAASPINQTLFEFIESYARKRQVLLTTDGDGNIVLARSATGAASINLENIINGQFNNIKSASVNYDFTKRFYKYTLQSQQNPGATGISFGADVSYENVAVQTGFALDSDIRTSRITEVISETSDSTVNLTRLAIWTKNLTRARSTEYECVVQGYHYDEAKTQIWKPNILVKVVDDFANINATLLIKSVEYGLSVDAGSTTTITLVDADSYTLQLKVDAATQKADKKGDDITFIE